MLKGRGLSPLWDVTVPYLNAFSFSSCMVSSRVELYHISHLLSLNKEFYTQAQSSLSLMRESEALAYSGPGVQAARNRAPEL